MRDREPAGGRPHPLLGVGECRFLVVELELAHRREPTVTDLDHQSRVHAYCSPSCPTASRSRRRRTSRRQPADRRVPRPRGRDHRVQLLEAGAQILGRAIGERRARPVLDTQSAVLSSPSSRSKSPRFTAIDAMVGRVAPVGERRALPGVVAPFEFAVGALEVVLVEAAVVVDQAVVADLGHVEGGRLVSVVVGPATPDADSSRSPRTASMRHSNCVYCSKMRSIAAPHPVRYPRSGHR